MKPNLQPSAVAAVSEDSLLATLKLVAALMAASGCLLAIYFYFYSITPRNFISPAMIGALGLICLALLRHNNVRLVAQLFVAGVLMAAVASVIAFGSLRSPGVMMFTAAVVTAGIFLSRMELIGSVVFTFVALSVLLWAEQQGLMAAPSMKVDLRTLISYLTIIALVGIMVYYARERTRRVHEQLFNELEARRRTEQERDISLERFARIFRTNPSPMLAQSARDGLILDVNPAFERTYGFSRDQMLRQEDTLLWAIPAQRKAYLEQLIERRHVFNFEAKAIRSNGSTFDVLLSSEMGDDRQDKLIITTAVDISSRTLALEKLRRSEERFAKAFNFNPLKMTITRLSDGAFLEVNQVRDPVQGLHRQELIGKTTLEVGTWLSAEERRQFVQSLQREGHLSGYDTRVRHVDGSLIDVKIWAELIEIDGEECILSCYVDTTQEKRKERLLISLAQGTGAEASKPFFDELTRHMAIALEADWVVISEPLSHNQMQTLSVWRDGAPGSQHTFGIAGTPCEQTLSQTALVVHASGLEQTFTRHALLPPDACAEAYVGQSLRDQDGSVIGVLNALWRTPIKPTTEMQALMAIFANRATAELIRLRRDREIKDLNATLEARVETRTAELQKLNAELDSFAYSVSHDLKSPLRTIDGFTRLLGEQLSGRLQPEEQVQFARVLRATRRMSTLIADLLALARVSQGPLERSAVDLSAMAIQILQVEQEKHPEHTLRWQVEPGLICDGDERLVRIALENMLGNAVKYTRKRTDPLIEFGRLAGPAGMPGPLFVRDNGVGFDMLQADKLFKPFQRLHRPGEFEGTGIGLATVHRIVERHGGSIQGESLPGAGATFHFTLSEEARLGTISPFSASPSAFSSGIEDSRSDASLIDGEMG